MSILGLVRGMSVIAMSWAVHFTMRSSSCNTKALVQVPYPDKLPHSCVLPDL